MLSGRLIFRFPNRAKVALAGMFVLAANALTYAQSCALCYTQAAGAGHRFIQGLRTGILVLIVPPMFMSVGITVLSYKKRNRCNDRDSPENSKDEW
jgi:membrane-associated HD superfamily phosphohydrolase